MATATTTNSLVDSLGVNTHLDFAAFGYENIGAVESAIRYLGLTNIRDSAQNGGDASLWQQVAQATGAKFDDYVGETSPSGMQTDLGYVSQLASEGILNYIEGGNEEDDAYPASLGNNLGITAQFQQQVYSLGQQLGLPVINMSFGSGWTAANNWAGNYDKVGDLSGSTNYANAHTYANPGQLPGDTISRLNGLANMAASSRPVMTTEIGWDEGLGFNQNDVAKYVLDAAFDGMKDGDVKSYFYALFNDASGAFGLMNADGSPKPAGQALHNLTTLLQDSGGSFSPGALDYSLSGNDNTVLMQKSDDSYWLAVWNESAGGHSDTLTLGSAASNISLFDPLTGTSAVQSAGNTGTFTFNVPDHPVLVEIGGASSSTAGNPPANTSPPATVTPASDTATTLATDPTTPANPNTQDPPASVPGTQTIAASTPPVSVDPTVVTNSDPSSTSGPSSTPAMTSGIVIAPTEANSVQLVSNSQITASSGDHMIFVGGTGDTVTATGGTEYIQAYQGGNTITTGSGDDTIRYAGSNNVIDAGGGSNRLEDSGSNNTIVLPGANQGNDDIYGYVMTNGDTFDMRSLLSGTSWNGDASSIGNFVKVTASGTNALIQVDPTGNGGPSSTVATLEGVGSISLNTLLAHSTT